MKNYIKNIISKRVVRRASYIILSYTIFYCFLYGNITSIVHYVGANIFQYNKSAITTDSKIVDEVKKYISNIKDIKNFKFIDFGCGEGTILIKMSDMFKELEGIEIDEGTYNISCKKTMQYPNVTIIHKDIISYQFTTKNTVLYMYEPLWCLNKKVAKKTYEILLSNLYSTFNDTEHTLYIVYVDAIFNKYADHSLFQKYQFQLLSKKNTGSVFFNRNIKVYKFNHTKR